MVGEVTWYLKSFPTTGTYSIDATPLLSVSQVPINVLPLLKRTLNPFTALFFSSLTIAFRIIFTWYIPSYSPSILARSLVTVNVL